MASNTSRTSLGLRLTPALRTHISSQTLVHAPEASVRLAAKKPLILPILATSLFAARFNMLIPRIRTDQDGKAM